MRKNLSFIAAALAVMFLTWAAAFFYQNYRGASVLITPPVRDVSILVSSSSSPFLLPAGFTVSVFARGLPGARVIARDTVGNLWVSQPSESTVSLLEVRDGKVVNQRPVFKNLQKPHGLAFDPDQPSTLYIAEENKISRVALDSNSPMEKIADLPAGGNHTTRTIGFGPDGRLYVAIGSSCNVCSEKDDRRAKIFSMKPDGTDMKEYARGLRNTVFFTWDEKGRMWGTDMGRDYLGDDLPPDEINILSEDKNYGWPICYGKNIHDTNFDKNVYIRAPCEEPFETPAFIDLPAHSAPLGLAFIPVGWPREYAGNLLVAYHGSWNRSVPTGYKIARITFDAAGNYIGAEDFMTGWLVEKGVIGRPVDLLVNQGVLYISDDRAGVIYKVEYKGDKSI